MEGSIARKLCRLAWYLVSNPDELPRYIADRRPGRQSPIDLEIPWFSYGAIDFLESYVQPNMTVFEWGSGGSTMFFSCRASTVTTIEDNSEWADRVTEKLREAGRHNATIILAKADVSSPEAFANSDYVNAIVPSTFDIIVIDGVEPPCGPPLRPTCFYVAEKSIKPGGIVVVDDSWRYSQLRIHNSAKKFKTFEGIGPVRPGVTSTDIYFY